MADTKLSQTFYDAMGKNRWRTLFLFALFPAMLLIILYCGSFILAAYGQNGNADPVQQATDIFFTFSPYVIGGSILWMIIMLLGGRNMILSLSGAKQIQKSDNPELFRIVENLSIRTGIKMPAV